MANPKSPNKVQGLAAKSLGQLGMSGLFIVLAYLITVRRRVAKVLLLCELRYLRFAKDKVLRIAIAISCRCEHILEAKLPWENVICHVDSLRFRVERFVSIEYV